MAITIVPVDADEYLYSPTGAFTFRNHPVKGWEITPGHAVLGLTDRYLRFAAVWADGRVAISFSNEVNLPDQSGFDIPGFESMGRVRFAAGGTSVVVELNMADMSEPYVWIPSNSADVITFYNTLPEMNGAQNGVITIGDSPLIPTMKHNGADISAWKYNGVDISAAKYNGVVLQ